jgi:lipopolysaccharide export system protein LptA
MISGTRRHWRSCVAFSTVLLATAAMAAGQPPRQAAPPNPGAEAAVTSTGVPNALQGFSQNRDQPVHISSRRLEVRDKDKVATFLGDVHVTQGDANLTCQTLLVYYEQGATPGAATTTLPPPQAPAGVQQQVRRLVAQGGVVVTQKDQTATGHEGVFDMKSNTVTLEGDVVVTQCQNVVHGDRLTVDLTTGVSHIEASKSSHGRVEGLFVPGREPHAPDVPCDPPKGPPAGPRP